MEYSFGNKHLEELYTAGKSKKYRFVDPAAANKFVEAVAVIKSAEIVQDFWQLRSLNFESLGGNNYSMRLSKKARLILEIQWENEEKQKGAVTIVDVTKHYE